MRILITGAAGSGTTTLGKALAHQRNVPLLDTDDYFWVQTEPPYTVQRSPEERGALLLDDLRRHERAVVSGAVMGWGEEIENSFNLIVFLYVETKIRLQRLERREIERFGKADPEFLDWASQYDAGTAEGRSLPWHNQWLAARKCPVIRLIGDMPLDEQMRQIKSQCSPQSFQLRPDRPEDAAELLSLFRDTVRRVNCQHYSPEQIRAWASDEIDVAEWAKRFEGRFVVVAEKAKGMVGFIELEDNGHIDRLYVSADHQRQGIGRALLAAVAAEAERCGISRLWSEVSITAKPLFEAAGFHVVAPQTVRVRGVDFLNYRMQRLLQ